MWYGRLGPEEDECPSDAAVLDAAALDPRLELILEGPKATKIEARRLLARLPGTAEHGAPMWVSIYRAFGLPNRLLEPAAGLPGRREPDDVESKILSTPHGDLPVHYAFEHRGRSIWVTAYFMAYRLEGIRSPLWTRLRHGPASVLGASWPITAVAIAGRMNPATRDQRLARMDAWLLEAWGHYQAVCGPAATSRISDNRPL
jgi:hypothetical protein